MFKKILYSALLLVICGIISLSSGLVFADDSNNLGSTGFTLSVNELSPSKYGYYDSPEANINGLLAYVTKILLFVIPTFAVLFMVVGGIKIILAGGDSSKVGQGKTIITFNIIAVAIALLSYSIIQLVTWIIWG